MQYHALQSGPRISRNTYTYLYSYSDTRQSDGKQMELNSSDLKFFEDHLARLVTTKVIFVVNNID